MRYLILLLAGLVAAWPAGLARAQTIPPAVIDSVVSVLPVWAGQARPDAGAAPEGSGVVIADGLIATAWHVIEPARRVDVRLSDGRILPARIRAHDAATDIALLEVDVPLRGLPMASTAPVSAPVCAVGNAFGLGLSVSCGVISATGVSTAGFNPIEDFVQTDAAVNPGSSGGALVNGAGALVGMLSAIYASDGDGNIGVNFAVSAPLLQRVSAALLAEGRFVPPNPQWRLGVPDQRVLARVAAPELVGLAPEGPAARAGLRRGDLILRIGDRSLRHPRDAIAALALLPAGRTSHPVEIDRDGQQQVIEVSFARPEPAPDTGSDTASGAAGAAPASQTDCPHAAPVCRMRQAVFPVSSFDPVGSATRIGPDLLVTNRHVVGDRMEAVVHTPDGPRAARVVPSDYGGDLVLLSVPDLPADGAVAVLGAGAGGVNGPLFAIGADIARQKVRVFAPGGRIAPPAPAAPLGRLHVTARMQPGVSGGALVDARGALAGIAVGGGDGRYEAIPAAQVQRLLAGRAAPEATALTEALGRAFARCDAGLSEARGTDMAPPALAALSDQCLLANNPGQLLEAGRVLSRLGAFDLAIGLHQAAADQVPNSINTRMSLLVSLQLAARFDAMTDHARWLLDMAPDDPQALRFSIQSGVWGGDPELAEAGYAALLRADPAQAQAARRFIDAAPPAPRSR